MTSPLWIRVGGELWKLSDFANIYVAESQLIFKQPGAGQEMEIDYDSNSDAEKALDDIHKILSDAALCIGEVE